MPDLVPQCGEVALLTIDRGLAPFDRDSLRLGQGQRRPRTINGVWEQGQHMRGRDLYGATDRFGAIWTDTMHR